MAVNITKSASTRENPIASLVPIRMSLNWVGWKIMFSSTKLSSSSVLPPHSLLNDKISPLFRAAIHVKAISRIVVAYAAGGRASTLVSFIDPAASSRSKTFIVYAAGASLST